MKTLLLLLLSLTLSPPVARPTLPVCRADAPPLMPYAADEEASPLVVTPDTDVRLDGRPCAFEDVPNNAVVVTLDVAADKKTIIRIFFRSKEK